MKLLYFFFLFLWLPIVYSQPPLDDSVALENYLDGIIKARMHDYHIAGATLSVVRRGQVVLKKGYGFADLESRIKVDPDSTLFRIGSISKLFVWTAIMQLYERQQIQLDDDINEYFTDFQIPDAFDQPITIRDLMTHTPGFEDYVIGLFRRDSSALRPLAEILSDEIPTRVRPPGTYASYSNHATGMAAHIVELVSGVSWEEYVEQHILTPIQLTRTTFRQPLPRGLEKDLSKGYIFKAGRYNEEEFEFIPLGAVGAAGTTAADMARFMIMNLNSGTIDSVTILDSTTANLMQSPAFRHHPHTNPMRHGFMDFSQNSENIIGHGGDTHLFHSLMAIWPERGLGLFLSFNTQSGGGKYSDILTNFVDHFFPEAWQTPSKTSEEVLKKFTGEYAVNRHPESRFTKVAKIAGISRVSIMDSLLRIQRGGEITYWSQIDETTFYNTQNSDVIAFEVNERSKVTHMFIGRSPIVALEKLTGIHTSEFHAGLLGLTIFFILCVILYWPLAWKIRHGYYTDYSRNLPAQAKYLAWFNALLLGLFYTGMMIILSNPNQIVYGVPSALKYLLVLPLISIVVTLAMILVTVHIWRKKESVFWSRLYYSSATFVFIMAIWQLNYWNLLGWKY